MQSVKILTTTSKKFTRHGEPAKYQEGLYQLSSNAYAWMVPNGSWGETNIGLVDCGGKSVLIDTCWDLHYAQEMLNGLAPVISRSPVEVVINTHSDGDHCWGNQLFKSKEIIATNACLQQIDHVKPGSLNAIKRCCGPLSHVPVAAIDKYFRYMDEMLKPYQFADVELTRPSHSFNGEYSCEINGIEIVVMEVGPAHTNGDAFVFLPQQKVVYAGDVAFINSTPVMWSGPVENLLAALHKLLALNADTIVPGHGPLGGAAEIQRIIDYWQFVQEQIHHRFQKDMTPYEAAYDLMLSSEFRSQPFAQWGEAERLLTNTYSLYRHWGARLANLPGPLGIMDVLRQQAKLAYSKAMS